MQKKLTKKERRKKDKQIGINKKKNNERGRKEGSRGRKIRERELRGNEIIIYRKINQKIDLYRQEMTAKRLKERERERCRNGR